MNGEEIGLVARMIEIIRSRSATRLRSRMISRAAVAVGLSSALSASVSARYSRTACSRNASDISSVVPWIDPSLCTQIG